MRNPINPDYPVTSVASIEELMGIAVAMEAEAARRYEQLARRTEGLDQPELVALFRELARLERDHERGLAAWAGREGRAAPVPAQFSWRLPETFGDEADERPLDPYQALAIAVRNEERAFAFYAYLSAMCADQGELRTRADALAREELQHVALLRGLRRRAFHSRPSPRPRLPVETLADLQRLSAQMQASAPQGESAAALSHAQEAMETFLSVAEDADRQDVLDEALHMAETAMARLARIRAKRPDAGNLA